MNFQPTHIERSLFHLLRIHLWEEAVDTKLFEELSEEDWESLYNLACEQGVQALAYDAVKHLPSHVFPPKKIILNWSVGSKEIESQNVWRRQVLAELCERCAKVQLEPVALRGLSIGACYPNPDLRECTDVDLWFPGHDLEADLMFEKMGLQLNQGNPKYTLCRFHGAEIKSHHTLLDHHGVLANRQIEQTLMDMWRHEGFRKLDVTDEVTVLRPAAMFQVIYNARHITGQMLEHFTLRQVIDWAMILRASQGHYDRDRALLILGMSNLMRVTGIVTRVAETYLGLPFDFVRLDTSACQEQADKLLHKMLRQQDLSEDTTILNWKGRLVQFARDYWLHRLMLKETYPAHIWHQIQGFVARIQGKRSLHPLIEKTMQNQQGMHEVKPEQLLPRGEIVLDMGAIQELLMGKRILVTGAAGSIGSEMVQQIAQFAPEAMMLVDQAETPMHDIRLMMARDFPIVPAETVVTSISNLTRMEHIFNTFRPDYVFHAAAYKHVPMMEDNPAEAVQNNIMGTKIIADLSVKYGVKKFVMVSTDKAVNPTNVMGCSKRICEMYCQAIGSQAYAKHTQFVTTRFGNVLGSNGSVIPIFQRQILAGGPVTVTHPDIIRFFMLIPEACQLVLQAGTMGNGGEIYVFDMGEPVKIVDLARRMIRLSGAKDIEIKFTGLRDGEKLYEEVLADEETTKPTTHPRIKIADVRMQPAAVVKQKVQDLIDLSYSYDDMAIVAAMKELVPEYHSAHSIYESLDVHQMTSIG